MDPKQKVIIVELVGWSKEQSAKLKKDIISQVKRRKLSDDFKAVVNFMVNETKVEDMNGYSYPFIRLLVNNGTITLELKTMLNILKYKIDIQTPFDIYVFAANQYVAANTHHPDKE